jgi:hypothetical protein
MPGLMPLLSSTMVSLSLSFGNAPASTVGYAIHGWCCVPFWERWKQAMPLVNWHSLAGSVQCTGIQVYNSGLFWGFIQHHQEALRQRYQG